MACVCVFRPAAPEGQGDQGALWAEEPADGGADGVLHQSGRRQQLGECQPCSEGSRGWMNCGCCLELVRVIWCAFGVCVCLRLREGERDCVCVCERELCACVCMRGGGCVLTCAHVCVYACMHICQGKCVKNMFCSCKFCSASWAHCAVTVEMYLLLWLWECTYCCDWEWNVLTLTCVAAPQLSVWSQQQYICGGGAGSYRRRWVHNIQPPSTSAHGHRPYKLSHVFLSCVTMKRSTI